MTRIIDKRNDWNQSHESKGREGRKIEMIVIHGMAITDENLVPKIWNERAASAHYGVKNVTLEMYVAPEDTAWHARNWNINLRSIAVEHLNSTGAPTWQFSEQTLSTSVEFIVDLLKQYHLTVNDIHMHKEFTITDCPQSLAEQTNWKEFLTRVADTTGEKLHLSPKLTPDGNFSEELIIAMQHIFRIPETGKVISQPILNRSLFNGNDEGFEFVTDKIAKGAPVVSILQKRLGINIDGFWGEETTKALQKRYEVEQTGIINKGDPLISDLVAQINTGLEDFVRHL